MKRKIHKTLPIKSKINIADVNAIGGIPKKWKTLLKYIKIFYFKPYNHECKNIMKMLKKKSIFKHHWANSDTLIGNIKDL